MSKTRFSVVVDSAFRVRDQYPEPTSFVIPVNDSVVNDYVNTPVMIFSWRSPTRVVTGTVVAGSQSSLILSDGLHNPINNYYTGCLVSLYNGATLLESSLAVAYDANNNTVQLQVAFINSISTYHDIRISYPDTMTNPYILQALGYDPEFIFEYTSLFLYNFSKKWIRPIRFINSNGLINLDEPVPLASYNVNDIFQIRTSRQILQFPLTTFYNSITKYSLQMGKHRYVIGSYVYTEPDVPSPVGTRQLFKIKDIILPGGELVLEVVEYGGPFGASLLYPLYDLDDPLADVNTLTNVQVQLTRTVINAGTNPIPSPENNVIYLGAQLYEEFFYYSYVVDGSYVILIDETNPYDFLVDINHLPLDERQYGFLSKRSVQCAMNVANFSIPDNSICMTVKLDYLILPNRRVRGFNKLLSFFPYVVVKLYNVDSSQYSRFGTITTNNPTTANCQFICPIGNLLNPTIIKFVEVTSDMTQILKLSPYHDMYFEVVLPNGQILQYERQFSSLGETLTSYSFSIRNTVACIFSFTVM